MTISLLRPPKVALEERNFITLSVSNKLVYAPLYPYDPSFPREVGILTLDEYVDKSLFVINKSLGVVILRHRGVYNYYAVVCYASYKSDLSYARAHFDVYSVVPTTSSLLAYLSGDYPDPYEVYYYRYRYVPTSIAGCTGSIIKGVGIGCKDSPVNPLVNLDKCTKSGVASLVDTTHPSGRFGYARTNNYIEFEYLGSYLLEPLSELVPPKAIVEVDVVKDKDGTIRPNLSTEKTEDEHRYDVSFGAIDYKGGSTMFVSLFSGNIGKYVEIARRKNLFADYVKHDLSYVREVYKVLRSENKDMLATENELAYHLIGREELEVDAVADFYEREVINLKRVNPARVADFDDVIRRWVGRAVKFNRTKAYGTLMKVMKV